MARGVPSVNPQTQLHVACIKVPAGKTHLKNEAGEKLKRVADLNSSLACIIRWKHDPSKVLEIAIECDISRQQVIINLEEEITKEMSELTEAKQTLAQFLADTGIEIMHTTIQT